MTKFILHGGNTSIRNEQNKKFFSEIVKNLPRKPKILLCLFSIEKNRWPEEFEQIKKNFEDNLNRDDIEFKMADKENFVEQVKWADAIHFRGGDERRLLNVLNLYPDISKDFEEKTVSGSSAGANMLAKYCYSTDSDKIEQGSGILPIKTFCHYFEDGSSKLEELKKYKENLKVFVLGEGEYVVINK